MNITQDVSATLAFIREDRRRIKDTKVVKGAEISSDCYLVLLVIKRCWREVKHKRPEEQNTLKWNVKK